MAAVATPAWPLGFPVRPRPASRRSGRRAQRPRLSAHPTCAASCRSGAQRRMSNTSSEPPVKLRRREVMPTTSTTAALTSEDGIFYPRKKHKAAACSAPNAHSSVITASAIPNSADNRKNSSVASTSSEPTRRSKGDAEDVPSPRLPTFQHQPSENRRKKPAPDEMVRTRLSYKTSEYSAAAGSANVPLLTKTP